MKSKLTKLKMLILTEGLTQRGLAHRAGINESTLSLIASGRYRPDASQRSRIARVLKRPETELFELSE
jgi:transcriptional regulator with XRE-family HTH domain